MSHEKNIVKKPWGYEYLAYSNEHVGLWFLNIKKDQKTSMHCHPNKTTGLILISGEAEVSFLSDTFNLKPFRKLMIRKGLFHSTKAIDPEGACVFEIETPVNKHDLVRLEDSYGREGMPYEDETFEIPKESECIWIEDPSPGKVQKYEAPKSTIVVKHIEKIEQLTGNDLGKNIMFLRGGLLTDYDIHVAGPGDIVSTDVIKKLTKVFKRLSKETIVLSVLPEE